MLSENPIGSSYLKVFRHLVREKSARGSHCQKGQHKLKQAACCSGGIKCRLCSTALSVRDAKHVSAAAEGVLLRTISGLYSTAEHQPRGASTRSTARRCSRLYSTARGCSRLCSTARRCSRLYGSTDTSIYWRPLLENLFQPAFQFSTVVLL